MIEFKHLRKGIGDKPFNAVVGAANILPENKLGKLYNANFLYEIVEKSKEQFLGVSPQEIGESKYESFREAKTLLDNGFLYAVVIPDEYTYLKSAKMAPIKTYVPSKIIYDSKELSDYLLNDKFLDIRFDRAFFVPSKGLLSLLDFSYDISDLSLVKNYSKSLNTL